MTIWDVRNCHLKGRFVSQKATFFMAVSVLPALKLHQVLSSCSKLIANCKIWGSQNGVTVKGLWAITPHGLTQATATTATFSVQEEREERKLLRLWRRRQQTSPKRRWMYANSKGLVPQNNSYTSLLRKICGKCIWYVCLTPERSPLRAYYQTVLSKEASCPVRSYVNHTRVLSFIN